MAAALVTAGCNATGGLLQKNEEPYQAPEYMEGEGDELSPLEAHLRARRMVDPAHPETSSRYTYKADQPHEDFHDRLKGGGVDGISAEPLSAPEHEEKFAQESVSSAPQSRTGRITPQTRVPKPGFKPVSSQQSASAVVIDGNPMAVPVPKHKPRDYAGAVSVAEDPSLTYIYGDSAVIDMRLGEHPGRTRLVLDLSGQGGYSYKIDNAAGFLIIELPGVGWNTETGRVFAGHALFKSFSVSELPGGGTALNLELKRPVKIDKALALPPNQNTGHRVYFDVTAAETP